MKKIPYLLSLVFLLSLTLFTACKDDEQPGPAEETTEEEKNRQLTSGAFTIATVEKGEETITLNPAATISFNTNGNYSITNGANLPTPAGSNLTANGSWVFADKDNFDQITLTPSGSEAIELTNVSLTDNSLSFEYQAAGTKPSDPTVPVTVNATR